MYAAADRYQLVVLDISIVFGAASFYLIDIVMQLINLRRMRMNPPQM